MVKKVEKQIKLPQKDIIRFQILTYCFLHGIILVSAELDCLTLLAEKNEVDLNTFCNEVFEKKIYGSPQTARNALRRIEKLGLIMKEGKSRKRIQLHPILHLQKEGNIMLDYKITNVETNQGPGPGTTNNPKS